MGNRLNVSHGHPRNKRLSSLTGLEVKQFFSTSGRGRSIFLDIPLYRSGDCRGFVGYGDADPSNVSPLVHGAEMRVAETRAVNRALRKAYGIGICSVEEVGSFAEPAHSSRESKKDRKSTRLNSSHDQISYAVFCLKKKKNSPPSVAPCCILITHALYNTAMILSIQLS